MGTDGISIGRLVQWRATTIVAVRRVDLSQLGLGVRIAVVSDVHARSDWYPERCVDNLVDVVNEIDGVDVVALLGDYVGHDATPITWSADCYARLDAPTIAVLGNHDAWTDGALIARELKRAGVRVLVNDAVAVRDVVPGARTDAWFVGLDTCWPFKRSRRDGARVDRAFASVPSGVDAVVLGHEPHIATLHEQVLHLAGHTHRGQVRSPIFGDRTARMHMPRFSEPYIGGLARVDVDHARDLPHAAARTTRRTRFVYTTGGVGYSTAPLRVLCPPEVVVIDT